MRPIAELLRSGSPLLPTLAVFGLAFALHLSGAGDPLDHRIHDAFVRLAPPDPPTPSSALPDVAVVTLDPRSLRALAEWPWPRAYHATAIERLDEVGAAAIAFDIDFSANAIASDDERFAASIASSGRVALATFSQTELLEGGGALEIVNRPIEPLARAARTLGNVLVPIDADGVVREVPALQTIGGEPIVSLARAAFAIATAPARATSTATATASAKSSDRSTTVGAANARVDYRRAHVPIPTVAFVDLIERRFAPEALAGRAVFIGATAAEFQDLWATPIDPALPGVMIQALAYRTAAAESLGQPTLRSAPAPGVAAMLLLLAVFLHPRRGVTKAARVLRFSSSAVAVVGLGWLALWTTGLVFPTAVALAVVAAQYALGIEGLERRVRRLADAHASSLDALEKVGSLTTDVVCPGGDDARPEASLELALRLLGDVVGARGVVLLRVGPDGAPTGDRLEWRPDPMDASGVSGEPMRDRLRIDDVAVRDALATRRTIERVDPAGGDSAPIVYAPLVAGAGVVGILVVFCGRTRRLESLERRTIATVGAQLALTAQNLQLIERLRETFESSIAAVASAVEARDGYTDQHCRRLAAFSSLMGTRLGMPAAEIHAMELGALLHDVGKIGIRDAILNKPDRLLPEERREMQRHPEIGAGIVAPVVGLEPTTLHCILHHHECFDGSGYPTGLAGRAIPLAARIVSIVDVWDALSTSRPYKKAFSQDEVRDLISKGAGTQFDPELVELFFQILDEQGEEMLELIARSTG